MITIGELCTGCWACLDSCPVSVLVADGAKVKVEGNCIDCGLCIPTCPINVISMAPVEKETVTAGKVEPVPLGIISKAVDQVKEEKPNEPTTNSGV
ncbi:4Fe-4S dicluster domain-containing protein [Aneurinibacillus sp. Ricciae_BoGa-3]|uniref:DUF362 domain-containing protein n=1 Tax=Aneurinibacillus sp. Ricciae_BoGa-3 TaxID=3022697 RepID=UPI002340CE4D|nr:4Fe-4S dicluster domain-containing protein [Aneurinibacillus sp. Ricciae_BoGa-3]WCK53838.1 4Fe-4S dicluster domain-containing protein [Aneurinibacillus sp. Ricciae_BoGa-3]